MRLDRSSPLGAGVACRQGTSRCLHLMSVQRKVFPLFAGFVHGPSFWAQNGIVVGKLNHLCYLIGTGETLSEFETRKSNTYTIQHDWVSRFKRCVDGGNVSDSPHHVCRLLDAIKMTSYFTPQCMRRWAFCPRRKR